MALDLKIGICVRDCNELWVTDGTGIYNSLLNPTGYGAPNIDVSDVQAATLYVTLPSGQTLDPIDVYPTLPNTADTPFILTAEDLGYGVSGKIEDGSISVRYVIQGSWLNPENDTEEYFTYTATCTIINTCNVSCCIKTQIAHINTTGCDACESDQNAVNAYNLLMALENAEGCGQIQKGLSFLRQLQLYCRSVNCNCC